MATGLGTLAKIGVGTPASWGVAWSAVDTLIPATKESITNNIQMIENEVLEAKASKRNPDLGLVEIGGAFEFDLDYYNMAMILRAAMGVATGTVYTFEDDLGDMLRLEIEKSVSRWRIDSLKIQRLVIEGAKGGILKGTCDIIGCVPTRSATAFPSLTLTTPSRIRFSNTTSNSYFYFGDQTDALTSADLLKIESFRLTINNNLKADDFSNETRYALEPKRNGFREVTLEIKCPRYEADTITDWKDAGTPLQAIFYATDGTKTFKIELPQLVITGGGNVNIPGPQVLTQEFTLTAYRNTSNTPLAAITDEARITIT